MHRRTIHNGAAGHPVAPNRKSGEVDRDRPVVGSTDQQFALSQENDRVVGVAQPGGAFGNGVQNGLDIGRRSAITRRISLVAVCCSRVSASSWLRDVTSSNRRTFSSAIKA